MTLGNMRSLGVRDLEAFCVNPGCHHQGLVAGARFPDSQEVPAVARRLVCTRCGSRKAMVRPNWQQMNAPGMGRGSSSTRER